MVAKNKIKKVVAVSAVSLIGFVGVGTASVSYAQESVAENSVSITNFRSTYQSKDRVVLTWDKVPGAVGYVLDYTEKYPDIYDNDTIYLEGTSNWYTWRTDPGVELDFTIQPYFGDDIDSNFVRTEVLQIATKGIPPVANLNNPNYSESTTTLEWEKTSDNVGKYLIQREEEDGTYSKVRTIYSDEEKLSYKVKNLASDTKYGFRVIAVDGTGDRSAPMAIGAETLPSPEIEEVAETPISGLRSTYQSKDRIVVTWDKKSEADAYKIVWFGAGTDHEDFDIVEKNWFTVETRSGQKNEITVIPWYGNNSKYSERASISVTSKGQTAVSKLTASEIDETSIQLRWLKAGEDVKYLVSGREKDGSYAKITTVKDNAEEVDFLVELEKLEFRTGDFDLENPEFKVVAINAEGEQSTHMLVAPGQQARVQ